MNSNHKLALALLAGASVGVAGTEVIHAQQAKTAPAYVIAEVELVDRTAPLQSYAEKVPATVKAFHGRYLVVGGKTQTLEGETPKSIVVIAFDSAEQARAWYDSPEYSALKPIRQNATKSRLFIVEGLLPH